MIDHLRKFLIEKERLPERKTMIYMYVTKRNILGARSPLDT